MRTAHSRTHNHSSFHFTYRHRHSIYADSRAQGPRFAQGGHMDQRLRSWVHSISVSLHFTPSTSTFCLCDFSKCEGPHFAKSGPPSPVPLWLALDTARRVHTPPLFDCTSPYRHLIYTDSGVRILVVRSKFWILFFKEKGILDARGTALGKKGG